MNAQEISRRIAEFPRWHYQFDLGGVRTPIFDERVNHAHQHRKRYFFDPFVEFCGGSLKGRRVLDLGCNAGWWSLLAARAGADFVTGIDGRDMHVDQSEFVFQASGIERKRYRFLKKNIFELDMRELGSFDVVFCLGLMYHISKPVELLENISRVNTDLLLIDTTLSQKEGALFEIAREDLEEPRHAVDYELVLLPTKQAVVECAKQFGYKTAVLKPPASPKEDPIGAENFRRGARRAFVCAKRSDLSTFPAPIEPISGSPTGLGGKIKGKLKGLLG